MAIMTEFTKMDWCCYAGAEPYADGSEPLLGGDTMVNVNGCYMDCLIVADGAGLIIEAVDPVEGEVNAMWIGRGWSKAEALAFARALPRMISTEILEAAQMECLAID